MTNSSQGAARRAHIARRRPACTIPERAPGYGSILWVFLGLSSLAVAGLAGAASPAPLLHVSGMTFVASRETGASLVLKAERARFDTDKETAHLEVVDARIPPEGDKGGFEMRCDRSEVDLASNDFYASGNVHGRADGDREFETEWVRYDHEKELLYTEAPVMLSESGTRLRGGGFRYLIRERRFTVTGGASLVQEPRSDPEPSREATP
jgi:LPS export ABC transporter protein LptC